jgi:hypothetical protein
LRADLNRAGEGVPEIGSYDGVRRPETDDHRNPQGGILPPLLADIALSELDEHFARQWREHMRTGKRRAALRKHGLGTPVSSATPTHVVVGTAPHLPRTW